MAIEGKHQPGSDRGHRPTGGAPPHAGGRRFLIGTNVVVATALVVAIVAVAQAIAYNVPGRWDMTSSGVNSLSEATENLLRNLEQNVRLTSLYFETDREEKDQPRYRRAVNDLLQLYEATHRARVTAEWINPLKDHGPLRDLKARLREKPAFKEQINTYKERIDKYTNELDARMRDLVETELRTIDQIGGKGLGESEAKTAVAPVENLLVRWTRILEESREQVDALTFSADPQYSAAVNELRSLYRDFTKTLKDVGNYGTEQVQGRPNLPEDQARFLRDAKTRYADLLADLETEVSALQKLEPLKIDELLAKLAPTANPILVETDKDAVVVDFSAVWPPVQEGMGRAGFDQRAFKGEEQLTAAILRVTHKKQTAVVFVRYGGEPLFMGGFMPGQPQAPYAAMKDQLEETNFIVKEWDVKSSMTPPEIDPKPTRTLYVVLNPSPPERGPMGQRGQEPPFGVTHRQAVLKTIGDAGRTLFVAGWYQGPFGAIPGKYEYSDYLNDQWGIEVQSDYLLIQTMSIDPGKYLATRDFFSIDDPQVTDHPIVSGPLAAQVALPWCAPLELADSPPDEVEQQRLMILPKRDGLWGVKNIQAYQEQLTQRQYLVKEPGDLEGPFTVAVAATRHDAKIVVVSARDFAVDSVAFARALGVTAHGLTIRSANPGNSALFINSLHWLNDNTEFMNIGQPIDAAVLAIGSDSTVKAVQALTIFVWPMLAVVFGGIAWWTRRR